MTDCEICRNHELCRLENKDKIKNCFYVYPTKEYLASKTEEYKLGYNKAIGDCIKEVEEEEKQHNHTITKDCLFWLKRKLEQLKEGGTSGTDNQ